MPYKNLNKQRQYQKKWNDKTNEAKKKQLGMPIGTASHRLKKSIFFELLKETNKNFCFDCKKVIETADEVSIQHKKVWLHVSPKLFWDLSNIAFSHKQCNKAERVRCEDNANAKLTSNQVLEIRKKYKKGVLGYKKLAKLYNVSSSSIARIIKKRNWLFNNGV